MALSKEDYHDVKGAMGKALAKKVSKATKDYAKETPKYRYKKERSMVRAWEKATGKSVPHSETAKNYKTGRAVKLTPLKGTAEGNKHRVHGDTKTTYFAPSKQHDGYGWKDKYKHKDYQ